MGKNIRAIKKRDESRGIAVQEAIDAYLQCAHVKKLSARTQEEYQDELGCFGQWCSEHSITQKNKTTIMIVELLDDPVMLHQVNDQLVHLYLEHLRATHKPSKKTNTEIAASTLAGVVRVIKTFLNWCLLDEQYSQHVQAIVVKRIEKPQVEEAIVEAFSAEQIEALFKACDKEESEHLQVRDRAILSVLLDSGLRATELCTLTIGNISLDSKDAYVRIHGKGNKWGEVGLGEKARRAVQKYIRMFREPTVEYEVQQENKNFSDRQLKQVVQQQLRQSLVFVNRYGKPLTKSGLYRIIERLSQWAGIDLELDCHPHVFRHTFAKLFMQNGGDIYQLSKLLRHSSVKVTELYLKSLRQSEARKGAKSVLDNL